MPADAVALSVFNSLLASIAEEMGASLIRSSMSPNIRERHDLSCAVFDAEGNLVAQAAHIPVHLGAMPASVEAVQPLAPVRARRRRHPQRPLPRRLPPAGRHHGLARVQPSRSRRRLIGYVASRAHQSDIGGMTPGSMPLASELIQEGLIIPPVRLYTAGRLNQDVLALILRNVRTPVERRGDFEAQVSAQRTGERRLMELAARYGTRVLRRRMRDVQDYAERLTRARLQRIPEGTTTFRGPARRRRHQRRARAHQRHDHRQGRHPRSRLRGHGAGTRGLDQRRARRRALGRLLRRVLPHRRRRPDQRRLASGPSASSSRPAASSRPRAIAPSRPATSRPRSASSIPCSAPSPGAMPEVIPAASSGTMNNVLIGGYDTCPRPAASPTTRPWRAAPAAARCARPQRRAHPHDQHPQHAGRSHRGHLPLPHRRLHHPSRLRRRRQAPRRRRPQAHLRVPRARRGHPDHRTPQFAAWGLEGGSPGASGRNLLVRSNGEQVELPAKTTFRVEAGDSVVIETPGGGGWGAPA